MTHPTALLAEHNLAAADAVADPRQAALDASAPSTDAGYPLANWCGIAWQTHGPRITAAIEDVLEFEFQFPGEAATHANAAALVERVLAGDFGRALQVEFLHAWDRAEDRHARDMAEERADAIGSEGY